MFRSSRFLPPFVTSLMALGAASLTACQQPQEPAQEETDASNESVMNLPVPKPDPALDRAGLLAAVAQAASATAAGTEPPKSVTSLDGRQFEVRIRFGCHGPSTELADEWLGWSFDPEKRTLRVRAKPTISKEDQLVGQLGGRDFEAVEGFWIPRPWLLQAVCPAGAAVRAASPESKPDDAAKASDKQTDQAASPDADSEETASEPIPKAPRIGIAQFFSSTDARTRRRDTRAYQAVKTLPEGQPLSSQGFNLVLSGRLRALPGRSVIECDAHGPASPPECIVSAEFLRVWIEKPQSREVVAEWGTG